MERVWKKIWKWGVIGLGLLLFILIAIPFFYGYYLGLTGLDQTNIQSPVVQIDIEKYSEIKEKIQRELTQFSNIVSEYSLSLQAGDTDTSRNKISDARNLLIDLKGNYEFVCDFQENNKELFDSDIETTIQNCKGYLDLMELCYPKYLDSLYSLTYLEGQINQMKTQSDVENYKNSCNSWLNNYNIAKGGCDTISQKYNLNVKLEDFSNMCKLS